MSSLPNKVSESLPSSPSVSPGLKPEVKLDKHSKEFKEASELGKSAYVEALGLDESAETMGRVSELLSDTRDDDGGGSIAGSSTGQAFDPAAVVAQLLQNLPPEKDMRKQIEREIKKEIDYLHTKAMKMMRNPKEMNYFEMSNILKKIRELKGVLLELLKSSFETLKTLWLRYVHGVM